MRYSIPPRSLPRFPRRKHPGCKVGRVSTLVRSGGPLSLSGGTVASLLGLSEHYDRRTVQESQSDPYYLNAGRLPPVRNALQERDPLLPG
jgi:hypothetical protein